MIHVTLTPFEIKEIGRHQPGTPEDLLIGLALAKKGIQFRPSFSGFTQDNMLTPWQVWRDPSTDVLHVWQGKNDRNQAHQR